MKFILNSKLKQLWTIKEYVIKYEYQKHESKHADKRFWYDESPHPNFEIDKNENIYMSNKNDTIKHGEIYVR